MDLLVAWGLFPLLLSAIAVGCGLLVGAASRIESLPRPLVPVVGFAFVVVVGQFVTLSGATAELLTPLIAVLALAGLALGRRELRPLPRWGLGAAAAVFAVYAAPVVLSGEATFAGYIRLDDTATWMALTDRVMEHGRSLEGLAPSTYEAALAFNLADGYPIGAFLPLGVGTELAGEDVAWLVQPYLAWLAAVLALALWQLARSLIDSPPLRAACAFVAAQAALLFGYAMWGGVKEVAAAALLAGGAALLGSTVAARFSPRSLVPIALVWAATVGILSAGGVIWLLPVGLAGLALAVRTLPRSTALARVMLVGVCVAALSLPVIAAGPLPPTSSPLDDPDARGNLVAPLDPAQVAGLWPVGDFRFEPGAEPVVAALIVVALVAAAVGVGAAVRRGAWASVAYVIGSLTGCAAIYLIGSPWVDAKALAIASPAILFAAVVGAGALLVGGRRVEGAVALAAVAGGVLWSNALAYRDVSLAPRAQLEELAAIGEEIAGQGPTLLTEYQPYGARHFLRGADPEAVSELRRRRIPLRDGDTVPKGRAADTDALDPGALFEYRTLVLRRSPVQSRPPAAYEPVWRGEYYEAWQRATGEVEPPARLPLGDSLDSTARPPCRGVRRLAAQADLLAARVPARITVPLGAGSLPEGWASAGRGPAVVAGSAATLERDVRVPRAGSYEVWLRGSIRPRAELRVDGKRIGSARHVLNNLGGYLSFGEARLARGRHKVALRLGGADLRPGSGGSPTTLGPLVLSAGEAADAELVAVPARRAARLCGREWDWIEARG